MLRRIATLSVQLPGSSQASGFETIILERSWPRSRGHLLLEYRTESGRRIPGQWFEDSERLTRVARRTAAFAASPDDVAIDEASGIMLQTYGADRRLTKLPELVQSRGSVLVSHRPERRAVVRLRTPGGASYAKLVRADRAAQVVRCGEFAKRIHGVETPRLEAVDAEAGFVLWSELPGRSLYELMRSRDLVTAAGKVGAALRSMHESGGPNELGCAHSAEVDALTMWLKRLYDYFPTRYRAAAETAGSIIAALEASEQGDALVHRDLHDKQILMQPDGHVGIIDFDTLAIGNPAIDVANLLAHLELRVLQGHCSPERSAAAVEAITAGYSRKVDVAALGHYLAACYLRLFCVYSFRPRWAQRVAPLLERASTSIEPAA